MKTKNNKITRKQNSPLLLELLDEITPIEMQQTKAKMELAARIEDLMHDQGFTKTKFAEIMDKQPSEITKWVSGTHNFTLDTLTHIAVVLKVDLKKLFEKTEVQFDFVQNLNIQVSIDQPYKYFPIFMENITELSGLSFRNNGFFDNLNSLAPYSKA